MGAVELPGRAPVRAGEVVHEIAARGGTSERRVVVEVAVRELDRARGHGGPHEVGAAARPDECADGLVVLDERADERESDEAGRAGDEDQVGAGTRGSRTMLVATRAMAPGSTSRFV